MPDVRLAATGMDSCPASDEDTEDELELARRNISTSRVHLLPSTSRQLVRKVKLNCQCFLPVYRLVIVLQEILLLTGRREQSSQFPARPGGRQFWWRRFHWPAGSITVRDWTQAICRGTSHQHSSRRWKILHNWLLFILWITMTITVLTPALNIHQFSFV